METRYCKICKNRIELDDSIELLTEGEVAHITCM